MATSLSYWQRVHRDVLLVGATIRLHWLASRFDFFPSEENLLISLWYDFAYYRLVLPEKTVYKFLDSRVLLLKEKTARSRRKARKRRLEGDLLKALYSGPIRLMVVDFLESPSPENYPPVLEAIWSAWRMPGGEEVKVEQNVGEVAEDYQVYEGGVDEVRLEEVVGGRVGERSLNAKTYIIAVQLYFELQGEEEEYESLSRQLPALRSFIREKFGIEKLPGRLEEFKGYSYKPVLKDKNSGRKGQLKMPFRQIGEHPEIFGEAISGQASKILEKHFS